MPVTHSYFSSWRSVLLVLGNQAITLGWLVSYFEDKNAESWEGWVYALCVVVCTVTFKCVTYVQQIFALTVLYVFVERFILYKDYVKKNAPKLCHRAR